MLLYIIIAIIMFGVLIAVHEFGHFFTAKLCGVRVNEFAIGMGPTLFSRKKGETTYALRALPIGGFCAMEGEDEASDDKRAFGNKAWWQRVIILVAGSAMNYLTGLLILLVLFSQISVIQQPVITSFFDGFTLEGESGLMVGDEIYSINGHRIYMAGDIGMFLNRANGDVMDIVVVRDGQQVTLDDLPLQLREYEGEEGLYFGLRFEQNDDATAGGRVKLAFYQSIDYVRMVWMSLGDLVRGAVGLQDMSGPIGIVTMIGEAGASADSTGQAMDRIMTLVAFIAINLAVMNMLPIPALDGGRIFFMIVNGFSLLFARRKLNPKYEGMVNMVCFICLMAFMVVVAVSDVAKLAA
ncbi:MAG: site-2 protease family protein [Oscillospiraceae bacterium]|nr:site-2 protease family protein [Oscillospiraceae bacterium]